MSIEYTNTLRTEQSTISRRVSVFTHAFLGYLNIEYSNLHPIFIHYANLL